MRASELPASPSRSVLTIGMRAADRRLEIERHAALLGRGGERDAVPRQQRLVGGDHRLAGRERGLDGGPRRIARAADQFDEHVDAGIGAPAAPDRRPSAAPRRSMPRFLLRERADTATTSIGRPQRAVSAACCCAISCTTEAPTVPRPAMPTFSG